MSELWLKINKIVLVERGDGLRKKNQKPIQDAVITNRKM